MSDPNNDSCSELIGKNGVFSPIFTIGFIIGIGEKTPFSPINLEQLSLFDSDNILVNGASGFNYLKMLPKKVISAIEKSI